MFQHGEQKKTIAILLISEKVKYIHDLIKDDDDDDDYNRNDLLDVKFNVKISSIESELNKKIESQPHLQRDEPHAEPIDS